jgi:hypothetical protein
VWRVSVWRNHIDSYRLLAALGGGIIVVEGGGIDCIQQEKNDAGL